MTQTPAMTWIGRGLTGLFARFMLGASLTPKLAGRPAELHRGFLGDRHTGRNPIPMDGSRMIFGGFDVILDV